ncbi:hypothetical protein [Paenibacillus xylaniclasticus]|uniref:hypothetical protein n=1 Tax=Paenibacillus xylaniclasticus TaxID=588083 RepID=UPI000FD9B367|nr:MULTISPECIES: hypothetical protein [Paenibacillus]GFN31620.1 hypothetical protein PCURB6_18800 [Paenibacillus curdlanolyticus]
MSEYINGHGDHSFAGQDTDMNHTGRDSAHTFHTNQDGLVNHHFEPHAYNTFSGTGQGLNYSDIMKLSDPLSQSHSYHMQPIDWSHVHVVKPHYVHTYVKSDGTVVSGHMRGDETGGYLRSNPDGDPTNNLNR